MGGIGRSNCLLVAIVVTMTWIVVNSQQTQQVIPIQSLPLQPLQLQLTGCAGQFMCSVVGNNAVIGSPFSNLVQCVPHSQRCDGTSNCANGADEANCPVHNATACIARGLSPCADEKACAKVCDGMRQCEVGDDERNCPAGCHCHSNQYACTSGGGCLDTCQVCDGVRDCPSGDDEANCPGRACPHGFYRCSDDMTCVIRSQICDGIPQCPLGDDESGCASAGCGVGYYRCADGVTCIFGGKVCDGFQNCPGNDDETDCNLVKCPVNTYRCPNNPLVCLPTSQICDGTTQCVGAGANDELLCRDGCGCAIGNLICSTGTCISLGSLCTGSLIAACPEEERITRPSGGAFCPVT